MNRCTYFGARPSKHFILNRLNAFCCFGMRRNENIIADDNLIIVVTNRILRVALSITLWPHYISCAS